MVAEDDREEEAKEEDKTVEMGVEELEVKVIRVAS